MRGRDLFERASPLLRVGVAIITCVPRPLCEAGLVALRYVPGKLGLGTRYLFVKRLAMSCGTNVAIYTGVFLHDLHKASFGSNIKVGEMCFIGASGGITIEDDVSLAHGCTVLSEEHDHRAPGPLRDTPLVFQPVVVETGVWIGAGVRILSGVRIGHHSAVGASSVVTKDVPPWSISAGVPARTLKQRMTVED